MPNYWWRKQQQQQTNNKKQQQQTNKQKKNKNKKNKKKQKTFEVWFKKSGLKKDCFSYAEITKKQELLSWIYTPNILICFALNWLGLLNANPTNQLVGTH